jgi:hypothetical protein
MRNPITLVGQRFGRLLVIDRKRNKEKRTTFYLCECDCGDTKWVSNSNLRSNTRSCRCLQKELVSKRSRKEDGYAIITAFINYYKRNAKVRKIGWELSRDKVKELILKPCFFCGRLGQTETKTQYNMTLFHNGIDRLDNSKGYTIENSVPCCKTCNLAKNDLSFEEFKNWVEVVYGSLFHI